MSIEFINNEGPNSLFEVFRRLAPSTRELEVVSAFATRTGIKRLEPHLRRISDRGKVNIVVGLYQGVTEPAALRLLHSLAKAAPGRFIASVSCSAVLHRKVFLFRGLKTSRLVVGSSNLTAGGLFSDGEFCVIVSGDLKEARRQIPELNNPDEEAVPLTLDLISRYERGRNRPKSGFSRAAAKKLLGFLKKRKPPPAVKRVPRWHRLSITGDLREKTVVVVEQQTGWKDDFCSVDRGDRVAEGDRVLLFTYADKVAWARVVQVVRVTRTALATPDGRHFFSYRELRKGYYRRKIEAALWKRLAAAGWKLSKSSRIKNRTITATQVVVLSNVFGR